MSSYIGMTMWAVVILAVFLIAWRMGYLIRLRDYVAETLEELKKCTWPTWEELKGSTALIVVSILLIGGFTVAVDFVCNVFVRWMT